ncbi:DUF3137 domain-containing protein [Dysgonomonas capnocytophagoides]|uniref:DUF3137 domain-containing protein n=1 Tax=Dysgonomonas capnocytophagoides TaxID=45254 RepID=UPI0033424E88
MENESLLTNLNLRVDDLLFNLRYILEPIEEQRVEVKRKTKIFWSILLALSFLIVLAALSGFLIILWAFIVVFIGGIVWYVMWISPMEKMMKNSFYEKVVPHIISEFLSDSSFSIDSCISESDYNKSDIYRKGVDRYSGDNLIWGILGETSVRFSKLHTEYKTERRDKNGNTKTDWSTIFKGVFLVADFNKNTKGKTYILKDSAEKILGGVGRWMQDKFGASGRGEMVYLEDSIFEKEYVVYSTDPVEARYILTPSMQECFIELSRYFGSGNVSASIIDGHLSLALSGRNKLFSFAGNKNLTDALTIRYYAENLLQILKVVEILNLNMRIWGR